MDFGISKNIFLEEASEIFEDIEKILNNVLMGSVTEVKVDELFRFVHTLKGNAGIFKFGAIEEISHKFEDLLDIYRNNNLTLSLDSASLFLDVKDLLETLSIIYVNDKKIDENTQISIDFMNTTLSREILKISYQLRKNNHNQTSAPIQQDTSEHKIELNLQKKTILIVDDSSMIRNVASVNAQENGFNVLTACDGTQGLDVLQNNQNIDLVFSDVNMPKMGGLEMIKKIKSDSKFEFLPIVMMTTEKSTELKNEAKQYGVKAWLVKPFHKEKFLTVIEKLLS